ncbi:POTRA domain-containing protein [Fortiea contorta]|uniref:POTRA domain-containing protein n=1 Tax=Fortiea contorta TaxID=1892405 RepID=UPI0003461B37|nr:POTRA domain-containing protein [Fortiea contorta]
MFVVKRGGNKWVFWWCLLVFILVKYDKVFAQSIAPGDVTIPADTPERIEQTIPQPPVSPVPLDKVPENIPQPPLQIPANEQPQAPAAGTERFLVKKIEVLGNTVLQAEVNQLVDGYNNREVSFEELVVLRTEITKLYVSNGYVNSGAFIAINNLPLSSGNIQIQVVEGKLENIEISGLRRLEKSYIHTRLKVAAGIPLNNF